MCGHHLLFVVFSPSARCANLQRPPIILFVVCLTRAAIHEAHIQPALDVYPTVTFHPTADGDKPVPQAKEQREKENPYPLCLVVSGV